MILCTITSGLSSLKSLHTFLTFLHTHVSPTQSTHPASVLCTIINPNTTGRCHRLAQNNTLASFSLVLPANWIARLSMIPLGTSDVNANAQVTAPERGAMMEQMGMRRSECRRETIAVLRGEMTQSMW